NTIAPLSADGLSRRHAKIYEKDGKWFVEDLGSMNGTYRLGEKVEGPTELNKRDLLQFGKFEILIDEIGEEAAPVAPAAAPAAETPATAPAPAPAPASTTAPASAPAAEAPAPAAASPLSPVKPAAPVRPVLPGARPVLRPGLKLPPKPFAGGAK
ncbi:MAG: FHA domain-containing protein, partial [Kiritimatiellae bacterium]|nr:FHA domain-containing protein [Kiritimatiellia bacterium]